MQIADRK